MKTTTLRLGLTLMALLMSGTSMAQSLTLTSLQMQSASQLRPINVDHVAVNDETMSVKLTGELPNPCYKSPMSKLTRDANNPNVLILSTASAVPREICVEKTQPYEVIVNLRDLVRRSGLILDPQSSYLLTVSGHDFQAVVDAKDLLAILI